MIKFLLKAQKILGHTSTIENSYLKSNEAFNFNGSASKYIFLLENRALKIRQKIRTQKRNGIKWKIKGSRMTKYFKF